MQKLVYNLKEVSQLTGWSADKVRSLIHRGALKAIDTNPGGIKPRFQVLAKELDRFLGVDQEPIPRRQPARRIDADVPKVFCRR